MPRAIRIHAFGDSSVMRYEEIPDPTPKPGEAVVTIEAVGVNFLDVYHRSGVYPIPLPITLGQEGAGVVRSVGEGVTSVKVGDCVAWTGVFGSYAEVNVIPANRLVHVPVGLQTKQAAAIMLQGITAHYLATSTYPLKSGDTALVHAGAGGVGLLLTQIAKMRGARVITTVSTPEKAALSRAAGADEVVLYSEQDFEAEVSRITNGRGVQVVYDSVGQATFEKSLNSLAPAWGHGSLRTVERQAGQDLSDRAAEGLLLPYASDDRALCRRARGARAAHERPLCLGARRQASSANGVRVSTQGCQGRSRGARRTEDDREDPADSLASIRICSAGARAVCIFAVERTLQRARVRGG